MTSLAHHQSAIRRAIAWGNYLRGTRYRLDDAVGYKDWLHFCLSHDDIDVLVNFSLADDTRPAATPGAEMARLVVIVRTSKGWDGDVEEFEPSQVAVRHGAVDLRFGNSGVVEHGGCFDVTVCLKRRSVSLALSLVPATVPAIVNDMMLVDGLPCHWFVVPRLQASGHVRVGDTCHVIDRANAYHDHNWGYFQWGLDFAWVWGGAHFGDPTSGCTLLFNRLTDGARNVEHGRDIAVWRGARLNRIFGPREVTIEERGWLRPRATFTLPRAAAVGAPAESVSVPARICGSARGRGDTLEFEFRCEHVCRILIPNDEGFGQTVLREVSGTIEVEGRVNNVPLASRGRAMFEFLGGA